MNSASISESGLFLKYKVYKAGMINLHVINVSCLYLRKNDMDNAETWRAINYNEGFKSFSKMIFNLSLYLNLSLNLDLNLNLRV